MIEEKDIVRIRGKNIVPEYKNVFPPDISEIYDNKLVKLIEEAILAIGNLNSYAKIVPNPDLLIGPMLLKEALASSEIEGTEATARDIVQHDAGMELPRRIKGEVLEVINHREATELGLKLLFEDKLPLHNRIIRKMHEKLMSNVRGGKRRAGEFRIGSNAIAKSNNIDSIIFLPPPAGQVEDLMKKFEDYTNEENPEVGVLLRCALMHYEFEAIHPFADGNGRIGRVLISLFLMKENMLEYPLLYLSGYLLRERKAYYDSLLDVTTKDDWITWLKFFLEGVKQQAFRSKVILNKIYGLYESHRKIVESEIKSVLPINRLVERVFKSPVIKATEAAELLRSDHTTAMSILRKMVRSGVLITDHSRKRNIPFYNESLIRLLDEI